MRFFKKRAPKVIYLPAAVAVLDPKRKSTVRIYNQEVARQAEALESRCRRELVYQGVWNLHELRDYFEDSMEVRDEIACDASMMSKIKFAMDGKIKPIHSSANRIYRLGRTRGGIYVALRMDNQYTSSHQVAERDLSHELRKLEIYCREAERRDKYDSSKFYREIDVPSFCVGILHNHEVGVLTEDVTRGGSLTIEGEDIGDTPVTVVGKDYRRKVLLDLDPDSIGVNGIYPLEGDQFQLKYFSPENVLRV